MLQTQFVQYHVDLIFDEFLIRMKPTAAVSIQIDMGILATDKNVFSMSSLLKSREAIFQRFSEPQFSETPEASFSLEITQAIILVRKE
jgi:hypothetical protein